MFTLKLEIRSQDPLRPCPQIIRDVFNSYDSCKDYISSFPDYLVLDYEIAPLIEQPVIETKKSTLSISTYWVQFRFKEHVGKTAHVISDVHPDKLNEVLNDSFPISDIYDIQIKPRVRNA